MRNALSHSKLLKLLGIMNKMLTTAKQENWQELDRLDSERRMLIDYDSEFSISRQSINVHTATEIARDSEYATLSKQIEQLDRAIMKTVTDARKLSLDQNRGLAGQVKAKNVYAQTSAITSVPG